MAELKIKPWDRQPGESAIAYQNFCFYRELAPAKRSLAAAYRASCAAKSKVPKYNPSERWSIWRDKHDWFGRTVAYDQHYADVRASEIELAVRKEARAYAQRVIHISGQATLAETAAVAQSNIADILSWDDQGRVSVRPSDQLPAHVTGAIKKIKSTTGKDGEPVLEFELHPKIPANQLLGQHFRLWDSDKDQVARAAVDVFTEILRKAQEGRFDILMEEMRPSLDRVPPGVIVERRVSLLGGENDVVFDDALVGQPAGEREDG